MTGIDNNMNRFGYLTTQPKRNNAFEEKINSAFESGDFGKMMMASYALQNPMFARAFMGKTDTNEDKIDFSNSRENIMDKVDAGYMSNSGEVNDVEPQENTTQLNKEQQQYAQQSGAFYAPKESISVVAQGQTDEVQQDYSELGATKGADGNYNVTKFMNEKGYIKDNKIDLDAMDKRQTEIEEDKSYIGLSSTANLENIKAGDAANLKALGIDPEDTDMIDKLKNQGIIGADNKYTADAATQLKKQKGLSQEVALYDGMIDKSAGQADSAEKSVKVYAQTGDKGVDGNSKEMDVDGDGNIAGENTDGKAIKTDLDAKAEKQLTTGNVETDKILAQKGVMDVDKNGNITVNTENLDADQLAQINKTGLSFSGKGKLTVKAGADQNVTLKVKGNSVVNLQGGSYNIKSEGDALQIQADNKTKIREIEGNDLQHLVVKGNGAQIDSKLDKLQNLQAVKIENSTLNNGTDIKAKDDVTVNMNKVTANAETKVTSEQGDALIKLQNAKTQAVTVKAANDKKAILEGDSKTKTGAITMEGYKATVVANGMSADKIDASKTNESGVFLAKGTKIKDGITVNTNGKDKNEIVYEQGDKNLEKINVKDAKGETKDVANGREMTSDDVINYLGWSEDQYKTAQKSEAAKAARTNAGGYGSYGDYGSAQPKDTRFERALKGFAIGMQAGQAVNPYASMGNPMMGMGYPTMNPMMGMQQQNPYLPQYPWIG